MYATAYIQLAMPSPQTPTWGAMHKTNHIIVHKSLVDTCGLTFITTKYVTENIAAHPAANIDTRVNVSHSLAR